MFVAYDVQMSNNQGRSNHYGQYIPTKLGASETSAMFGHVISGNVAAQYALSAGTYEFKALNRGHIFSLAPSLPSWCNGELVKVSYLVEGGVDSQAAQVEIVLDSPQKGIHVPGGAKVKFEVSQGVLLVDERVGTKGNVPEVFDKKIQTPLIKQGSELLQYLLPGDSIAQSGKLTVAAGHSIQR